MKYKFRYLYILCNVFGKYGSKLSLPTTHEWMSHFLPSYFDARICNSERKLSGRDGEYNKGGQ